MIHTPSLPPSIRPYVSKYPLIYLTIQVNRSETLRSAGTKKEKKDKSRGVLKGIFGGRVGNLCDACCLLFSLSVFVGVSD